MITIQHCKTAIAMAALLGATGAFAAGTMSRPEYSAAKERIGADYKADKLACAKFSANEKDICMEQAKGKDKVALAELEYRYTAKPGDSTKVAVAKADASYAVAKEMCDDKAGNVKDVCVSEAKAAHTKALADANMVRKIGAAKTDAVEDKNDADYKVAIEKCGSLAGDARTSCVSAAKLRFQKT